MAIEAAILSAWERCEFKFCNQDDATVTAIILDENPHQNRWSELPLEYKCAWKRICQVAWGQQIAKKRPGLWSWLCSERGEINNRHPTSGGRAKWRERCCKAYRPE